MTLLSHLHLSLPPGAQPSGLTSAKCVLKRVEGLFRHPPPQPQSSSSSPPLAPPLLPPTLVPSFPLIYSLVGRAAVLSLCGWDLWSQGPWQKQKGICQYLWETLLLLLLLSLVYTASLDTQALIRHIDHRRDSISPESSQRTFITSKAKNTHRTHTCKAPAATTAAAVAEDYCCESSQRLSVCTSAEQLNPAPAPLPLLHGQEWQGSQK